MLGDRFEVRATLGRGGTSMVYRVHDRTRDAARALKVLKWEFRHSRRARRAFDREANFLHTMCHPGVIRAYGKGNLGDRPFLILEDLGAETLHRYLERHGRLDVDLAVYIVCSLCEILEYVHTQAVHRDVNPRNILITPTGSLRLIDFGLAHGLGPGDDSPSAPSLMGTSIGTFGFSAPELRSDPSCVDLRSDVYSVGAIFFRMLSGIVPMKFSAITDTRDELPASFNTFLRKTLGRLPEHRYASVAEASAALLDVYHAARGLPSMRGRA